MAPRENARRKGQNGWLRNRGGEKKEQTKNVQGSVVSLLCISWNNRKKKHKRRRRGPEDRENEPKGKTWHEEKSLQSMFRTENHKSKQKHGGKTPEGGKQNKNKGWSDALV